MRKIVMAFVIFSLMATLVIAWDDCPYGLVNDPYPGSCRRYVDTNHDGYCDHSQLIPASNVVTPPVDVSQNETAGQETDQLKQDILGTGMYHIIPIAVILIILYLLTHILSKKDVIKVADHRKLWNWALLATFAVVGILGLILAMCINYGWEVPFSTKTLFYHVEIGIAMAVISIFHILWHWNYWRGKPECKDETKKKKMRN